MNMNQKKAAVLEGQIGDHFVCTVIEVCGNTYGVAKHNRDRITFAIEHGGMIVAYRQPEFVNKPIDLPETGESIVVRKEDVARNDKGGFHALTWGLYRELKAAKETIRVRDEVASRAKEPAPAPVPMAEETWTVTPQASEKKTRRMPRITQPIQRPDAVDISADCSLDLGNAIEGGYKLDATIAPVPSEVPVDQTK